MTGSRFLVIVFTDVRPTVLISSASYAVVVADVRPVVFLPAASYGEEIQKTTTISAIFYTFNTYTSLHPYLRDVSFQ
jgi:hypothetical protein